MGKVIGDFTAAVAIDGSTNYLLIQPGSSSTAYNKINRNVLLGVTGQPADISTAQSLTNKTLDNSNTLTTRDDRFTLQDSGDTTKQAVFQLSGITTATTRTYTLPDATTTLVGTGTTQTLTGKTLTSPTITGGSISNSTIAVDSIGEFTVNNGVTIDGLNIMNGALNTANSVTTPSVTDSAITPAKLQTGTGSGWSWQTWATTWTNLTVGNGTTNSSKYVQTGKTVFFKYNFTLGTTSSIGSAPTFSLPVTSTIEQAQQIFGRLTYSDVSTGDIYEGTLLWDSTTTMKLAANNSSATYLKNDFFSSTIPVAFGAGDRLSLWGFYEAA